MKKRYTFLLKNWLRFGLTISLATCLSLEVSAQNGPSIQWDKTFGGNQADELCVLQQTTDGGYILGGRSESGISGDKSQNTVGVWDYWIVKQDASGNKVWENTLVGYHNDYLTSLRQTSDGGYILGGISNSGVGGDKSQASNGGQDFWIIKLNANGNKIWDKTLGGSNWDGLMSLQQTSDGGYILGGYSYSGISGDKSQAARGDMDWWVIKLNVSGNIVWDKTFGGSGEDQLVSLQQTSDGGYILGGSSNSNIGIDKSQASKGGGDFWVIKLDANGSKTWDKTIGGSGNDALYSIQQTSDGGYVLGGNSDSGISGDKTQAFQGGYKDYWVVKLDANGNKIWDKTFGGSEGDLLFSLQQTTDGGYILGGLSESDNDGDKSEVSKGGADYWIVKLNGSGNKIWDKTIGGSGLDWLMSLQQTSDGGYILGGYSRSNISGDKSQISQGYADYWVIKLGPDVLGIKPSEEHFPVSIFPNPSQGKFNIQLSNLPTSKAELTISDLLGRVVFKQEFKVYNNQLSEEITLPNAKGIYLLQLKAGEQITSRKIVVE